MAATDEPPGKKITTRSLIDYFLIRQSADHSSGVKLLLLMKILKYFLHLKESTSATITIKNHLSDAIDKPTILIGVVLELRAFN